MGRLVVAEHAQIEFAAMLENRTVLRVEIVLILNGSITVKFGMPSQQDIGRRILIPNIRVPFGLASDRGLH